jgi:uncharacterized membrane protein (DUF2068 family)
MDEPHPHLSKDVYGLRVIAVTEVLKGLGAVVAAVLLITHRHSDYAAAARHLLHALHISNTSHIARQVILWADNIEPERVTLVTMLVSLYACFRLAEAWGLWHVRTWAEWLGFANGVLYLPLEIIELARGFNWLKLTVLIINIIVVAYLAWELYKGRREARSRKLRGSPSPASVSS